MRCITNYFNNIIVLFSLKLSNFCRLNDEWVEISGHKKKQIRKRMRLCNLPETAKSTIREKLFGVSPPSSPSSKPILEKREKLVIETNQLDTSWIKAKREDETKLNVANSQNDPKEYPSARSASPPRVKHNRKFKPCSTSTRAFPSSYGYSATFPKPPIGLFWCLSS